jgi:hypothetical protein
MNKLTVLAFLPRYHLWQGRQREHRSKYTSKDRLRLQFVIYTYMCRFLLLRPAMVASCAGRLFDRVIQRLESRISSLVSSTVTLLWSHDEPGISFSNAFTSFLNSFGCSSGISPGAPSSAVTLLWSHDEPGTSFSTAFACSSSISPGASLSPFICDSFGACVWCSVSTASDEPPKSLANAPSQSGNKAGVSFPGEIVSPILTFSPSATETGNCSN